MPASVDVSGGQVYTAVTTSQTGPDITSPVTRGVVLVLDMTVPGTGSVTLTIQGKDRMSGKYYTLLAGAAITTVSTNVYTVFPGAAVAANVSANGTLPDLWRWIVTANNANPTTFTVGFTMLA